MAVQDDVLSWIASEPRVYRPGHSVVDRPDAPNIDGRYIQRGNPVHITPETAPPAGVFTARTPDEAWQLAFQSFRRSYPNHTLDAFKAAMIFIGPAPQVANGRFVIDLEVSP